MRRWLAALLVRGPDARFIRHDLEELYARDRARGVSLWRAHGRYASYLLRSAASVWRARAHWPGLPGVNALDLTLAFRMLVRNPVLTMVGGLAMALGIPIALVPIQLANAINADLGFEESDRIVGLEYWDRVDSRQATLHDYERWKSELTTVEPLAAAHRRIDNVIGGEGLVEVARGAEMTASAFAVPRVQPILGRTLLESDERKGAPPVVVIGHHLWQSQFAQAPDVLGRTLRFGRLVRTVVGVMPEGFLFPARELFWVPLQDRAGHYEFGRGPRLWVFGRLKHGVSREQAQSEFSTVGRRIAADHPTTHADVRADVIMYQHAISGLKPSPDRLYILYVMSLLTLAVTCGNVGTLMLARTAGRSNEIAVRNALGASRARIVMQLFVESLVLAVLSAAAGVALADLIVARQPTLKLFESYMPFWFSLRVRPASVLVAGGFAVFSALIAGLLPALKVTGKRAYHSLQRQSSGGSGLRFGAAATVLIVAEVAIAVAGLSGVTSVARGAFRHRSLGDGIAAEEYLTTELKLESAGASVPEFTSRLRTLQEEVLRRLAAEPGVRAVSLADRLPGMEHVRAQIEIEDTARSSIAPHPQVINVAYVDRAFFEALGQPILLGRNFEARDMMPRGRPVIVNRSFVEMVLDGQSPIGRRFRYLGKAQQPPAPWMEIVGLVRDLGMNIVDPDKGAGVYHLIAPGEYNPPQLVVRLAGDAAAFVPRLRTLLVEIEPGLVISNPVRLDGVFSNQLWQAQFSAAMFTLVAMIAVVLSSAGLYALMAFSVAQRSREIAIRTALGARPSRIVAAVVRRALLQLAAGVVIGVGLAVAIVPDILNNVIMVENWRQMLAAVSLAMIAIGLLACVVPTRRALQIQPVDALKEIG